MPLFHGSYLTGFLGLDNPYIRENENFIFFLELIGAHLGSALVNTLVEQHLKQKNKELEHKNMFLDTLWHLNDKKKAQIPIIAMTANAFEEDRKKAFDAGMNGHIAKPIDIRKLGSVILSVLNCKRMWNIWNFYLWLLVEQRGRYQDML